MGVWAAGSFGSDTASDFVADLQDFATLSSTLTKLEKTKGVLDADDAIIAIAASDLLAITIGRPPADLPDDLPQFAREAVSDDLLSTARTLVKRVRKGSELAELWAEEGDEEWRSELDELLVRLTPSKPYKVPKKKKKVELPDDFLGYCYICFGQVTERDGLVFEETTEEVGTCTTTPHRLCIEKKMTGLSWNADGSPTAEARRVLLQGMGFDV